MIQLIFSLHCLTSAYLLSFLFLLPSTTLLLLFNQRNKGFFYFDAVCFIASVLENIAESEVHHIFKPNVFAVLCAVTFFLVVPDDEKFEKRASVMDDFAADKNLWPFYSYASRYSIPSALMYLSRDMYCDPFYPKLVKHLRPLRRIIKTVQNYRTPIFWVRRTLHISFISCMQHTQY